MIASLIEWSLRNRLLVIAVALLLLGWGAYETRRMPVDVFPDLTAPTVTVVTEAHGMAPEETETLITFPIETALNGAPGVRRVRSSTGIGISVVSVEFAWGTDIYQARQIVAEKLQLARNSLPPDVDAPVLAPITSIMGEIMFIALTSDRHTSAELKTTADWLIRRRLLAVPGVAEVIPNGGDTKQFQVVVKPERLAAYQLTLDELVRALRAGNANTSAGFYLEGGQEYLIHGRGRIARLDDIGNTLVALRREEPVLVRHLADVAIGTAPKRGTAAHNAKPAVVLGIQKQPAVNTLDLTARLDATLADIAKSLPEGMKLETRIFRQSDFIAVSIENLMTALRDGTILVIAIVLAFLASARATAITLLALPLSLVVAVLALKAFGATLNTMTLGGMAIALGALVDDAIIVVENIVRRLRENRARPKTTQHAVSSVVFQATREIQGSIVYATLIIMLVFLPLFFLTGIEGRLMQPLGLAYIVALAASLLVAITVTPVLAAWWLPAARAVTAVHETRAVRVVKAGYAKLLDATLKRWKTITLAASALLVAALAGLGMAGHAFLPDFNEGSLTVGTVTLPGTSLAESDRIGQLVEQILLRQPEVAATARRTGRAELDPHAQAIYASEIEVSLKMGTRSKEALLETLRKDLTAVPGTNVTIGQPISHRIDHMLSGTRANIAVKIFGPDLFELRRLAEQVRWAMAAVPGVVDLSLEQQSDIPLLTATLRREAIARYGLSAQDVADAMETAFSGRPVSRIREGSASFDLVVRYDERYKESVEALRATLITTPSGARVPLHALAEIRKDSGPNTISREDVQRKTVVQANVAGRDLGSVVDDIRALVEASVRLPAGYHIAYGGQFESAEAASRTLLVLGALVIAAMFLLLYVAFRSSRDAILVMLNLPLALVGGVAGMYLAGGVLSVATIIGFTTLFGIATRNGVMLISHVRRLIEEEGVRDPTEAVRRGAMERVVPILMTAAAAALALVPLALSGGAPGSEIQAPMAIVILFGLVSSTALNMVVLPALYLRFGRVVRSQSASSESDRNF